MYPDTDNNYGRWLTGKKATLSFNKAAGVQVVTRKALLGHASGDITTHYSAAELGELLAACERVVDWSIAQTPTLSLVHKVGQKSVYDIFGIKCKPCPRYTPSSRINYNVMTSCR